MNIQKTDNTNFGMAIVCKQGESLLRNYMFDKLGSKQYIKVENMIQAQSTNPVDIYASVKNKNGTKRLEAEVGPKVFKENVFQSGVKVLKKAVKYANKLYKEKSDNDKILKDFHSRGIDI